MSQTRERFRSKSLHVYEIADLLGLSERTLRHWQHDLKLRSDPLKIQNLLDRGQTPTPMYLGRPHVRCASADAERVLGFLHG